MSNMRMIQIAVVGGVGSGKSHVLATIQKALQSEYGHDLMVVSRDLYLERNLNVSDDKMEKPNKATTVMVLTECGKSDYEHDLKQMISSKIGDPIDFDFVPPISVGIDLASGSDYSAELKSSVTAELPELNVATGGEPPIKEPCCSGSAANGNQLNEKRDNAFIVAQLLSNNKISPELRKKAESKMLKLLDELI